MMRRLRLAAIVSLLLLPAMASADTGVWVNPRPYNPLGYQQLTAASATKLTVPAGATYAVLVCESQTIRYRDDGTDPTTSVGMPLSPGIYLPILGAKSLAQMSIIQVSSSPAATCNALYYN